MAQVVADLKADGEAEPSPQIGHSVVMPCAL